MPKRRKYLRQAAAATLLTAASFYAPSPVASQDLCTGYGPQTPRDISSPAGANSRLFTSAPVASRMNLCNLHTHTNAEHKGPGFSVSAGRGELRLEVQRNGLPY